MNQYIQTVRGITRNKIIDSYKSLTNGKVTMTVLLKDVLSICYFDFVFFKMTSYLVMLPTLKLEGPLKIYLSYTFVKCELCADYSGLQDHLYVTRFGLRVTFAVVLKPKWAAYHLRIRVSTNKGNIVKLQQNRPGKSTSSER